MDLTHKRCLNPVHCDDLTPRSTTASFSKHWLMIVICRVSRDVAHKSESKRTPRHDFRPPLDYQWLGAEFQGVTSCGASVTARGRDREHAQ
ncbi:hypothetical protein CPC08DRAFT_708269 [Agrocybe pediades]|nr:hypothetical protein CPC08DRAFT_708269 [Agrocybe pediades]